MMCSQKCICNLTEAHKKDFIRIFGVWHGLPSLFGDLELVDPKVNNGSQQGFRVGDLEFEFELSV